MAQQYFLGFQSASGEYIYLTEIDLSRPKFWWDSLYLQPNPTAALRFTEQEAQKLAELIQIEVSWAFQRVQPIPCPTS